MIKKFVILILVYFTCAPVLPSYLAPPGITEKSRDFLSFTSEFIVPRPVIMLYKPSGYISASIRNKSQLQIPAVNELLPEPLNRLNCIGRLDKYTSGLLLFEPGSKLTQVLTKSTKFPDDIPIPKTYIATVNGYITQEAVQKLLDGITIMHKNKKDMWWKLTASAQKVSILNRFKENGMYKSRVELVITKGAYHQVRQMLGNIGFEVIALKRTKIGPFELGELEKEAYRELTEVEYQYLQDYSDKRIPFLVRERKQQQPRIYRKKRVNLYWDKATIVPWHEIVENITKQPKGPDSSQLLSYGSIENQKNYWINSIETRWKIVDFCNDIINGTIATTPKLKEHIKQLNTRLLTGKKGRVLYKPPSILSETWAIRSIAEKGEKAFMKEIAGVLTPAPDISDEYFAYMLNLLQSILVQRLRTCDRNEIISHIADFYYFFIKERICIAGNNALVSNICNGLLRLYGINGIPPIPREVFIHNIDDFRILFFKQVHTYNPTLIQIPSSHISYYRLSTEIPLQSY